MKAVYIPTAATMRADAIGLCHNSSHLGSEKVHNSSYKYAHSIRMYENIVFLQRHVMCVKKTSRVIGRWREKYDPWEFQPIVRMN